LIPRLVTAALAALAPLVLAPAALAQAPAAQRFPVKPVRVIVAFGAGGIADTIARSVGQKLSDRWGQPVVIENRGGAGGTVGAKAVSAAAPDGYTLLVHTAAASVNVSLSKEAPDPLVDLTPVAVTASTPTIFIVHRSSQAKGLLDYAKTTREGKFTYGTAGVGTTEHLTAEFVFRAGAGLDPVHVPFQGGQAPVNAVFAQQVDMASTTVPTAFSLIRNGSVRVLAVATHKRVPSLPDVPTLAEAGFRDFDNRSWIAFFAPPKTPPAIVQALNTEINAAMTAQDVRDRLSGIGMDVQTSGVAEFTDFLKTEVAKWAQVVKTTGIGAN
jgi:tripartite-type tricarboxylate transporter receptor subunit TctC